MGESDVASREKGQLKREKLKGDLPSVIVSCGNRTIKIRAKSNGKVKDWVAAINDAGLRPPEGWCHPHRYGSFAPPRGLTEDGSHAQWLIDGQAAFDAIASSIEEAKSEIFITGWWVCPELYLRRPFHANESTRLDALLEAKAKQGVQRSKAPNEKAIPLLMPQQQMVIPHYMGKSKEKDGQDEEMEGSHKDLKRDDSFSDQSSYQDIPLLLPQEADGNVTNQEQELNGLEASHVFPDHQNRNRRVLPFSFRKSKMEPSISDMQMKGFVDNHNLPSRQKSLDAVVLPGVQQLDKEWWENQEWGDQVFPTDEAGQVGPCTPCRCQVIRSIGPWSAGTCQTEGSIHSAYCSLIARAEHFIYIEV
ncbi:hypothetical protein ACLOJK_017751 [Asimina triloba]